MNTLQKKIIFRAAFKLAALYLVCFLGAIGVCSTYKITAYVFHIPPVFWVSIVFLIFCLGWFFYCVGCAAKQGLTDTDTARGLRLLLAGFSYLVVFGTLIGFFFVLIIGFINN